MNNINDLKTQKIVKSFPLNNFTYQFPYPNINSEDCLFYTLFKRTNNLKNLL